MRASVWISFALVLGSCVQPEAPSEDWVVSETSARPNVILLMADDLGWGDVGYHGHPRMQTPHLDQMAANGLRFERFYAAAPVCSPTRGSCLTGRHPYRLGIPFANSGHLQANERTLAELLGEQGYATGHFGKWHLGTLSRTVKDSNRGGPKGAAHYAPPWEHGFDFCFSTEAKVPTFDPMIDPEKGGAYGTAYWHEDGSRATHNLDGDDSRIIMDRVLPFVRDSVRAERPFFAVVWFHTPHLPLKAGPEDRAPFADLSEARQHYYGAVRAMDREIGRLRAELAALGVADDTLLWFASDNGPEGKAGKAPGSSGGLRGRKRDLYEGGIRVPGILEWPGGIPAARSTEVPALTSDYLPTLCDLLAIPPPQADLDGISLTRWFAGSTAARPQGIGFESRNTVAWIDNQHKLVGHLKPPAKEEEAPTEPSPQPDMTPSPQSDNTPRPVVRWELYDLGNDPAESQDLYVSHPLRAARLVAACENWRLARHHDTMSPSTPGQPLDETPPRRRFSWPAFLCRPAGRRNAPTQRAVHHRR